MADTNLQSNQAYDVMLDKEIRELAYQYWEQRGCPIASPEIDWYRAVATVNREHTRYGRPLLP